MKLFVTQIILLKAGQEESFNEYEDTVIPLMEKYHGRLLYRIRCHEDYVRCRRDEMPHEIHIISFPHQEAFNEYLQDPKRQQLAMVREKIVRQDLSILGQIRSD